jgi:hypothetical protein
MHCARVETLAYHFWPTYFIQMVVWLAQSVAKMPQSGVAFSRLIYPLHLVFVLLESNFIG